MSRPGPLLWTFLALAAGACSGDGSPPSVASQAPTPSDRCTAQNGPVAEAATLTMGPAPGLPSTAAALEPLEIVGTVYDEGCSPLGGVSLRAWQTDSDGVYGPGHGTDNLRCCYFQGSVTTDPAGRFKLLTTVPGHYQGEQRPPPAHIHVEARAGGGVATMAEIVFAGDPYLPQPAGDDYAVVTLSGDPGHRRRGVATIVLKS
jgi:protocatechuate 3,4-dioxygenase beta subunit